MFVYLFLVFGFFRFIVVRIGGERSVLLELRQITISHGRETVRNPNTPEKRYSGLCQHPKEKQKRKKY